MADVNLNLNGEDFEEVKKSLVFRLARLTEGSEEYKRLWGLTGRVFRAEWGSFNAVELAKTQAAPETPTPLPHRHIQAQAPASSTSSSFKPALPPRLTYQPQSAENAQSTPYISEPKARRFWAIYKKSNKPKAAVDEKLKSLGFSNYKKITVGKYDELINWLQS